MKIEIVCEKKEINNAESDNVTDFANTFVKRLCRHRQRPTTGMGCNKFKNSELVFPREDGKGERQRRKEELLKQQLMVIKSLLLSCAFRKDEMKRTLCELHSTNIIYHFLSFSLCSIRNSIFLKRNSFFSSQRPQSSHQLKMEIFHHFNLKPFPHLSLFNGSGVTSGLAG